jgi:hypothetical protein
METVDTNKFIPVDISEDNTTYRVYHRSISGIQFTPIYEPPVRNGNFQEFISSSSGTMMPLLKNFYINGMFPLDQRENDNITVCCDGSVRNAMGGYGVSFSINENTVNSTRMKIQPGYNAFQSYRDVKHMVCSEPLHYMIQFRHSLNQEAGAGFKLI